ncbi:uncharacterized protein LOC120110856 isoform X1 [Phoenix dactylifera]|uniref:Uncharacterized protein LOC120110856 isoform X1 n=1 Tax=Phoenix dactylifera TaxID=42345 RepID=A0A8B9AHA9_PHODC|nr:uncharacterized protein LOC120110856 isoform X1 [Phoenix dactylifera]XP_038982659.1 uncharacterized protein LOC120110856 isoform X1 [Phoenix dactylifera]
MAASDLRLLVLFCSWALMAGSAACQGPPGLSYVVSSYARGETRLRPYDWTYLRVELPPWFSSMAMTFLSDADIDMEQMERLPKSTLPVICFKEGSPPIPDISETYLKDSFSNFILNGSFGGAQNLSNVDQCIPFQENLTVILTNEQISPGIWYIGFFNGLGPARTQSKMISRGKAYVFSTSIFVEGCPTSTIWGPYCNQTVNMISCSQSLTNKQSRNLLDLTMYKSGSLNHMVRTGDHRKAGYHLVSKRYAIEGKQVVSNASMLTTTENLITCSNSIESSCLGLGELKFYFLDILGVASQFKITSTDFRLNQTSSMDNPANFSGMLLMCYVRFNAMPLRTLHDHSADISRAPLIVKSPKIGRWFIAIEAVNQTEVNGVIQERYSDIRLCFSFQWQVYECLGGKAGVNCTWETYVLQRVPKRSSSSPLESYYLPIMEYGSTANSDFSLEHLLSNSSVEQSGWTYFFLDIPHGAAGANMHVQLTSDSKINYEIYSRFGGLPSIDSWDYYANSTASSNGSAFLALNDLSGKRIEFYIVYAREGTWCVGLKHPLDNHFKHQTTMSISLDGCPSHCNYNGACHSSIDQSGLTFYSYCACDRDHGGFDCSNELVTPKGHMWQSIFLVASNAAAILPAFWALRQKAYAEWILFSSSGISSGLYHACDVGTWCVLSFHVLQFLDFWLSFMAVVSTFIYMAAIDEASKRAIHTIVSILTALLALMGATRSANIVIVIAIGILGLLFGWFLEFSTAHRSIYCPPRFNLNMPERWQNIKSWFWNLMRTLQKRFRWRFILLGFMALALAATSWKMETNESYWIWHSLWHITIYTSSFFFLCSTCANRSNEQQEPEYQLTRQDSSSRAEIRE